jgi:hypothetical protein
MSDQEHRARARARHRVAVLHRTTLRALELEPDPIFGEEAISLILTLTEESWSESGQLAPTYARADIPLRFVRGR